MVSRWLFLLLLALPVAAPAVAEPPPEMAGVVTAHNRWRGQVGTPPLVWSDRLAEFARTWAGTLAGRGCAMEHSRTGRYGENLAWFRNQAPTAPQVVDLWAGERADYDHTAKRCRPGAVCGHYTQIIDRRSLEVGCARATCGGGSEEIWVCSYDPPGNVVGQPPF